MCQKETRQKMKPWMLLLVINFSVVVSIVFSYRHSDSGDKILQDRIAALEMKTSRPASESQAALGVRRQHHPEFNEGDSNESIIACRWGYWPIRGKCVDIHNISYLAGAVSRLESFENVQDEIKAADNSSKIYDCPAGQVWKLNTDTCVPVPEFKSQKIHCDDHFDPHRFSSAAISCEDWNTDSCRYFMPDSWEAQVPGQDVAECVPLQANCPRRFPTAVSCCTADPGLPVRQCSGFRFVINVAQ